MKQKDPDPDMLAPLLDDDGELYNNYTAIAVYKVILEPYIIGFYQLLFIFEFHFIDLDESQNLINPHWFKKKAFLTGQESGGSLTYPIYLTHRNHGVML